jgi:hypothetical protein
VIETVGGKPCVAVVGLSDRQNRIVAQRCGMLARLVFIPSSRSDTRYSPSVDLVILSRFVPHRFTVGARRLRRLYCGGGLTAICRAIHEFVANWMCC